jgi:hypothetical protein
MEPMRCLKLGLLAVLPLTFALVGCKRDDGQSAGVATLRSGTPEGVRVTSAPAPESGADQAADRLAAALCTHERECVRTSGRSEQSSEEGALLAESVCVADMKPGARRSIDAWECTPAVARAGLTDCMAAIKAEPCHETRLKETSVPACRSSEICKRGQNVSGL